jgi:hypothetical protein
MRQMLERAAVQRERERADKKSQQGSLGAYHLLEKSIKTGRYTGKVHMKNNTG